MSVTTYDNRADWLKARVMGLGASDAPVILGLSPFKSALQLYHEKLGMATESAGEQEWLRWGLALEGPIAERYSEVTGRRVERNQNPYTIHWSDDPRTPWAFATLDGRCWNAQDEEGALEIKNASVYVGEKWAEEPPVDYQVQNQHQQMVGAYGYGSIAALIGGNHFKWCDIPRNNDFINKILMPALTEFWGRVERQEPPPIDGSESAKAFLAQLYPKDVGTTIALDGEAVDWDAELEEAKATIKDAEAKKLLAENRLKAAIGENSAATLPNGLVYTFKAQSRGEHIVKASTFRVLRRKGSVK